MKILAKYFLVSVFILSSHILSAQNLTQGEYFIDTDPGIGYATQISFSPDSIVDFNFVADLSSTTNGMHTLYVRFKDDSGRWGGSVRTTFVREETQLGVSPNVNYCEYYFDNDPGYGLGNSISISPDSVIDFNTTLDLSTAPIGLSSLYLRCKDASGLWSHNLSKPILVSATLTTTNISRIEYYFDTDPGFGLGYPFSISPDTLIEIQQLTPDASLIAGFHILYIRAQNESGAWSNSINRPVLLMQDNQTPNITKLEYFIDTDPGIGLGQAITISNDTLLDVNTALDLTSTSPGFHIAYVRAINAFGSSSTTYYLPFLNSGEGTPLFSKLEYFIDNDPGFGMGQNFTITNDTIIEINSAFDLTSVTSGLHVAYVRGMNNNGAWGTCYTMPFINIGANNTPVFTKLEYFIDTDPGIGLANQLGLSSDTLIDFNFNATIDTVSPGLHIFYVRAANNNNDWSTTYVQPFLNTKNSASPNIKAFRFYIDSVDVSNYEQIEVSADSLFDGTVTANISAISKGLHQIYVIALNENDSWSVAYHDTICVGPLAAFAVDPVCLGEPTSTFNLTTDADGATQYSWDYNSDGITDVNTVNGSITYPTVGTKTIRLIVNNSGLCPDTAYSSAFVHDLPYPIITSNSGKLGFCIEDSLVLNTGNYSTYSWSSGSTSSYSTIYTSGDVILTVSDSNNCYNTDTVTIPVLQRPLVEGIVKYDSLGTLFNVTKGQVQIYYSDTLGNLAPLTTATINANGTYSFGTVPLGDVTLFSIPDSLIFYPDLGSIYYNGATIWDSVPTLTIGCEDTLYQTIVHPYLKPLSGGTSLVSGRIVTGYGPRKPGEPKRGAGVYLEQIPGGSVAYRVSNDSGNFKFNNIPEGTFRLMVNIPGKRLDSTYTITIAPSTTLKDTDNVFFINDTLIYVEDTHLTVDSIFVKDTTSVVDTSNESISENLILKRIEVYPNPLRNESKVYFENTSVIKDFSVQILTLTGQQLFTTTTSNLEPGKHQIQLQRNRFEASGIYLLRYGGNHEKSVTKILVE